MGTFMLSHRHAPEECAAVFAAWRGFESPLRRRPALASCERGGHAVWWTVEADTERHALALLPEYVADRTEVSQVSDVAIP